MITHVGLDADDTLWENLIYFEAVEQAFADMMAPVAEPKTVHKVLLETERRNVPLYGYGVQSFMLSMLEAGSELWQGQMPPKLADAIIAEGRGLLEHPMVLLDGVAETVAHLSERYHLILITKGCLLHQERKLGASGLGPYFDRIEIVSHKDSTTYQGIFGDDVERAVMVGDSMRSDIRPMLDAGGWAVHIPPKATWAMEADVTPDSHPKYRGARRFGDVPEILNNLL